MSMWSRPMPRFPGQSPFGGASFQPGQFGAQEPQQMAAPTGMQQSEPAPQKSSNAQLSTTTPNTQERPAPTPIQPGYNQAVPGGTQGMRPNNIGQPAGMPMMSAAAADMQTPSPMKNGMEWGVGGEQEPWPVQNNVSSTTVSMWDRVMKNPAAEYPKFLAALGIQLPPGTAFDPSRFTPEFLNNMMNIITSAAAIPGYRDGTAFGDFRGFFANQAKNLLIPAQQPPAQQPPPTPTPDEDTVYSDPGVGTQYQPQGDIQRYLKNQQIAQRRAASAARRQRYPRLMPKGNGVYT